MDNFFKYDKINLIANEIEYYAKMINIINKKNGHKNRKVVRGKQANRTKSQNSENGDVIFSEEEPE